jgi:hypothetical protein
MQDVRLHRNGGPRMPPVPTWADNQVQTLLFDDVGRDLTNKNDTVQGIW